MIEHMVLAREGRRPIRNLFVVTILLAAVVSTCVADDTVIIRTGTDEQRELSGTIVDWTAEALTFRTSSGRESDLPTSEIVGFETNWPVEKTAADQSFAERQFDRALAQYRAALSNENRVWATRLLQAEVVWCLRSLARPDEACNEFFRLLAMDATRQYFAAIPLAWSTARPSPALERRALSWLEHEEPVVRLIGASWLLSTDRGRSASTLEQLTSGSDSIIAQTAEAQLWRTKITTADDADVLRWKEQVSRIPFASRGGPYLALGRVMAYRKQHEQAAMAFMRVPTMYPKDSQMVAEALLAAGGELEQLGRVGEASSLYRELVNRYESTPQAGQASTRLKAFTDEGGDE